MKGKLLQEWEVLKVEVWSISNQWTFFIELYKNSEHADILRKTDPLFFSIVFESLLKTLIISLTKIGDPVKTGRNENLTIATILGTLSSLNIDAQCSDTFAKASSYKSKFTENIKNLKKLRDKRIAHLDYQTALHISEDIIRDRDTILDQLECSFNNLHNFMNTIQAYLQNNETAYVFLDTQRSISNVIDILKKELTQKLEHKNQLNERRVSLLNQTK